MRLSRQAAFTIAMLAASAGRSEGQSGALALSSAAAARGSAVSLTLTFSRGGAAAPAALQWTIGYSPADVAGITVAAGAAATAAAKTVACAASTGAYKCIAYGMNTTAIGDGTVAAVTLTVGAAAAATAPVRITDALGASPGGAAIAVTGAGGSLAVSDPVVVSLGSLVCDSGLTTPGAVNCSVSLTAPAAAGASVLLSSNDVSLSPPGSVAIPPGGQSANFTASAAVVPADRSAVITAAYGGGTASATVQLRAPSAGFTPVRVNAGGGAYTDGLGRTWSADTGYSGGTAYTAAASILGTASAPLYRSMRSQAGVLQYQFAVPNGPYTLTLKFAELEFPSAGQRRFGIVVNGQTAISEFDIAAQAGGAFIAVDRSFPVNVAGGQVAIQLVPGSAGVPCLNALELVSGIVPAVSVSPVAATLKPSQTLQFTPVVTGAANTAVTWSLIPPMGTVNAAGLYTAPSAIAAPTQAMLVATSAADATKTATAFLNLQPADPPAFQPIRVNAGGRSYTDPAGRMWAADQGFSGGSTYSTWSPIAASTDDPLYQSSRWKSGGFGYRFAVPNGTYTVKLKFAELKFKTAGQRKFGVAINGQTVLTDFDILAQAGAPLTAVDRSFAVTAASGQIAIDFLQGPADSPQVNAIEVVFLLTN